MKFAFAFVVSAIASEPSFDEWASEYGFNAADDVMKTKYEANAAQYDAWNADPEQTATFGVNQFSGMTFDEFASVYLTAKPMGDESDLAYLGEEPVLESRAGDVDWAVTPVKDQGSCGSCWAFATIGAIEHAHKLATGETVDLAEQQLVDCDTSQDLGCDGGRPDWAMTYLNGKSIYTTASYEYTARDGSCKSGTESGVSINGYTTVPKSEEGLESALAKSAVTVLVYADSSFQGYKSGILANPSTSCDLNHAVLATGYGSDFWKIKNSWGPSWGEGGFIRFAKTSSGCGPFGMFYDHPVAPQSTTGVEV